MLNKKRLTCFWDFTQAHSVYRFSQTKCNEEVYVDYNLYIPAVLKDRNLKYVFRPQVHGGKFGEYSVDFLNGTSKEKLGIDPKNLRLP